jgi:dienelactone hydrolase
MSCTHLTINHRLARRLQEAGIAVLDYDNRYIGLSPGEPRQRIRVGEWLEDLRSAIAYARTLEGIDGDRIGISGSSLGGGLAIAAAAADPMIAAVALAAPHVNGLSNNPDASLPDRLRLAQRLLADKVGRLCGRPPTTVAAFGSPGTPALITEELEVEGWYKALAEIDELEWVIPREHARSAELGEWRNEVLAWDLLTVLSFRPGRLARKIQCPILAQLGTRDRVCPIGPQERALRRAANVDIQRLPMNHFGGFWGDGFEHSVAGQIDFFRRTLGTG